MAESQWDKDHPRRDQVNDRLANQNKRIHHEVKEGEMSRAKAARLHKDDHHVRRESAYDPLRQFDMKLLRASPVSF